MLRYNYKILTLSAPHPQSYCLLGSNGSGKSTLLRCIAEGSIPRFPSHIHVLYIDQDARTPAVPAIEYVIAGDGELRTLQSERAELAAKAEQTEADANRLAEIEEELHIIDAATAETRAAAALRALGFAESQIHARLDTLSGGWRVKCSLARALFCPPRFLLLDEPTNHLDLHEILRLQRLLLQLDEMCTVIVSHDQAFVDAVATDVIVLKDRKLQYFKGNLSAYLKDKEDRLTKQQRLYDNQERKRAHLQATIDRGIQTAKKTGNDKVLGEWRGKEKAG